MTQSRRFIVICPRLDLDWESQTEHSAADERAAYMLDLCSSLARRGHEVEIWTVQCDGQPATQMLADGVLVRCFSGQQNHLPPRNRPGGWVSQWLFNASAHLSKVPGLVATVVTFHWEAGVAGRSLAHKFGLMHVHVPHALGAASHDEHLGSDVDGAGLSRSRAHQNEEDRRTCHVASMVIATSARQRELLIGDGYCALADRVVVFPQSPGNGERFAAALPPVTSSSSVSLASIGGNDSTNPAAARPRRRPWFVDAALPSRGRYGIA